MPCYYPISAFHDRVRGEVLFVERGGRDAAPIFLPCGQCIGCRLERSRQWAVRCMHEAKMYDENCFITLTYAPECLPRDGSLHYPHFQAFMRRLRKRFSPRKIRFFMGGEYGENFSRPHYHALLFNLDFRDKLYFKRMAYGVLYTSRVLEELWPYGFSTIGACTFESAAYVARYCVDKVNGQRASEHYRVVDPETGELHEVVPEFGHMSLKPGIGAPWLHKFWQDVFPRGEVVVNARLAKSPRFYDKWFAKADELGYADMKELRYSRRQVGENTDERLAVQEQVAQARLSSLNRSYHVSE